MLVQLRAAALNHRDVWIQQGQYAGIKLPCTLGADGSGEIVMLGAGVTGWAVGAPVIICPGVAWGDEQRAQGRDFRVLGMPDPGTFAEYITVPARYVRPRPAHLSWEQAAALPLAGLTAYRAAFGRARVQDGERVLVTGVGGRRSLAGGPVLRRPRSRGVGDFGRRRQASPRPGPTPGPARRP
ncbi:MAG: medium chain dehydrogenase/reductase family protein [Hymenobacter sp.]